MTVMETIQQSLEQLSPTERKAADYILKNANQVVDFTVKDLAAASDVSEATVIRMCQHLGFKGYWPLRISLSKDMAQYQQSETGETGGEAHSVPGILQGYARMMENMAKNVDAQAVYGAVELLRSCDMAHLIATGNTTPLIEHMAFRLGRAGVKCTFSGIASYYMNQINLAGEKDVVIAISQSGSSKSVIEGVELARQKHLKVIVITEFQNSTLAGLADQVIRAKGDFSRFDFYVNYNHLCVMAAVEMVMDVLEHDEKTKQIIEEKNTEALELMSDRKL